MSALYACAVFVLRWSAIATHLPKRTDNEIKNYWNTHIKKRLTKMGIDPVTHKPKNDALLSSDGQSKTAANLSHMAQWESARLEAEARLVRESKIRSHSLQQQFGSSSSTFASSSSASTSASALNNNSNNKPEAPPPPPPPPPPSPPPSRSSLDVLKAWNSGGWLKSNEGSGAIASNVGVSGDLESPTSTLSFSENAPPIMNGIGGENNNNNDSAMPMIEFVGNSGNSSSLVKEEAEQEWKSTYDSSITTTFSSGLHEFTMNMEGTWASESLRTSGSHDIVEEGFTNLLLKTNSDDPSLSSEDGGESKNGDGGGGTNSDFYEDNNNYWNSILNLVNSSPSHSPMF